MMEGETPPFWWRDTSWQSAVLAPAAALYGSVARRRMERGQRAALDAPVLCVGNFTVGGGGKTPTALALGRAARGEGLRPGFLSRGYGGAATAPVLVDPHHHSARTVGDEPLLLAAEAPTVVAADRAQGAALLLGAGACDVVIMDDGFQSARLRTDFALLVIDAGRGLGNGRVIPAGPLRAPLVDQIRHADALLVIGRGEAGDDAIRRTARGGKPVFEANLRPRNGTDVSGRRVLAFAGIADPEKFYRTLREVGAEIVRSRDFPDHHPLSDEEVGDLLDLADREDLVPVTTGKDAIRFTGGSAATQRLRERTVVLGVDLVFDPDTLPARFIREAQAAFRRRKFG